MRTRGNKCEDAKKFVARLRARSVPDEVIFDTPIRVKCAANAGMANPQMMTQKFQEGLALSQMPGVNARWFLESLIAYKYGSQAVEKALLPEGQDSEPIQRREAMIENNSFGQGMPLPVAPEDAHYEHIQEHLKPLIPVVQQFQKTQNIPAEAVAALTIGIEHTGEHMQYLSKDETKKQQMQAITPAFRQVQSIARGILNKMQAQQQQGGGQAPQGGQPQQQAPQQPQKSASESISISFKDLGIEPKNALLQQLGLPPMQPIPMPNGRS
jgi:hypothetical protein